VTDLLRPHADPADHWDPASLYALAYQGRVDLKGVIIDYPPAMTGAMRSLLKTLPRSS
jgi:hypothetical protein